MGGRLAGWLEGGDGWRDVWIDGWRDEERAGREKCADLCVDR